MTRLARLALTAPAMLAPSGALAHPGHYGELAGHDHWIALGALAAAGVITAAVLLAKLRGKKADADTDTDDAEPEEHAADDGAAGTGQQA